MLRANKYSILLSSVNNYIVMIENLFIINYELNIFWLLFVLHFIETNVALIGWERRPIDDCFSNELLYELNGCHLWTNSTICPKYCPLNQCLIQLYLS